jgi:hypothetical protein
MRARSYFFSALLVLITFLLSTAALAWIRTTC